jgi:nitrite reductase/ring-hydroxylating ferredoxin subunit
MLVKVARPGDIADAGLQFVRAGGQEIVLCRVGNRYYAISRRCSHRNGALERGSLDGTILTCPLHHVQFDVTTGEVLNYPLADYADDLPGQEQAQQTGTAAPMDTEVGNLQTFAVVLEADAILVQVEGAAIEQDSEESSA